MLHVKQWCKWFPSDTSIHEKSHESRLKQSTQEGFDPILRTQQWVQQCIQQGFSEEPEKEQDDSKSNKEEESPCCICHTLKPDHALYPCGHLCICQPCKPALHSSFKCCPICSQTFTDVIKIFKI